MAKKFVSFITGLGLLAMSATAFGQTAGTSTSPGTSSPSSSAPLTALECMAQAVDTREAAVAAALETSYNNIRTALTTRRSSLAAAWALTDRIQRRNAVRSAWSLFHGTWRTNDRTLRRSKSLAWAQFNVAKLTCDIANEGEPRGES